MLVLSRHKGEKAVIDLRKFGAGLVTVTAVDIRSDKVRFGFDGDDDIPINRLEVFEAIERDKTKDCFGA